MDNKSCDNSLPNTRTSSFTHIDLNYIENYTENHLPRFFTGETWYHYDTSKGRLDPITIIHFNDVYNIESNDDGQPGGISRFITALQATSNNHPLILFSGDTFNPSRLSSHTKGRHMVPFLNMLKIHTACFGNHDFDFGIDHLEYMTGSTRFPWLISNVKDIHTNETLANGIKYRLFEWQGIKIGLIGLVEMEWIETLTCIEPSDIIYQDFVEASNELCKTLKSKEAELIIALTHMRAPNDERLARECQDLDLILGGHDHEYFGAQKFGNCIVVKSGCDFKEFTKITIYPALEVPVKHGEDQTSYQRKSTYSLNKEELGSLRVHEEEQTVLAPSNVPEGSFIMPGFFNGSKFDWQRIHVDPNIYPTNKHVDIIVKKYLKEIEENMDEVIGEIADSIETRFGVIRKNESNSGNWLCDLMRTEMHSNIALLNSGTIRSDCEFNPGNFTAKDLTSMLPMNDGLVVIAITGSQLTIALENAVCKYPKTEGRFPQISGVRFHFDSRKAPGSRILTDSIFIYEKQTSTYEPMVPDQTYSLATKEYLQSGRDGYEVFSTCPIIRDSETNSTLQTMVQNVFSLAHLANGSTKTHSYITEHKLNHFINMDESERLSSYGFLYVDGKYKLSPKIDGRIKNISE